jgi:hypothetical protein
MDQVQEGSHLQQNMVQMLDTRQVSKMQIPTNPRIAPGSATGTVKIDRGSISTGGPAKPAYVSVYMPESDTKQASTVEDASKVELLIKISIFSFFCTIVKSSLEFLSHRTS